MKKLSYIALIILAGLLVHFIFKGINTSKVSKEKIKQLENIISIEENNIDSLNVKISVLSDSIAKKDIVVVNLNKSEENAKQQARNANYKYKELIKLIPENVKDSLLNYQAREGLLLDENSELNTALVLCDSVKGVQVGIISDLKEVISTKDLIEQSQQTIIDSQGNIITALKKDVKKQRWQGRKEGGVFGIILATVVLLVI